MRKIFDWIKKKRWWVVGIIGLIASFALFVGIMLAAYRWVYIPLAQLEYTSSCSPMPEDFSEEALAGTWIANGPGHSDTLIIRTDGTYKQLVHRGTAFDSPIQYESDWQTWYLAHSDESISYLHLEGMRFCGMNNGISCSVRDGGGYDYCRDESIKMLNEGILIVLASFGPNERPLPGTEIPQYTISLSYPLGSQGSWGYRLHSPDQ